jgi:hypothetical protein
VPVLRCPPAGLVAPAPRACRLLRPRPESAIRAGVPRRSQETASLTPHPGSARWGPRCLRRNRRSHPPGGISPPTQRNCSYLPSRTLVDGRVVVEIAPRAARAMAPERAGPERASRGGVSLAWLHTNSDGFHRGTSLLGRTRRRVGGPGSRPSPSDRSRPAGHKKRLHAVENEKRPAPQRSSERFVVTTGPAPKAAISRATCARNRFTPSVRSTAAADHR